MGGMAAFIPNRKDPILNDKAMKKVRDDKLRESFDGFDGTWVAHPDLVPLAHEVFSKALAEQPHQKHREISKNSISAEDLQNFTISNGKITRAGLEQNVAVALQYMTCWLGGTGAVAINNLMEDAATAEICRTSIWQWIKHGKTLNNGQLVTKDLFAQMLLQEAAVVREEVGEELWQQQQFERAQALLLQITTADQLVDFLTLPAYELLTA